MATCNKASQDYFLEIKIDNTTQGEMRRLTNLNLENLKIGETNLKGTDNIFIDGGEDLRNMTKGVLQFFHKPGIPNTRVITFDINSNGQENTSAMVMEYNPNNGGDLIRHFTGTGLYKWDQNADLYVRDIFSVFIGSFANRITKLFVQDIDASGNINASNYTLNGTTIADWDEISSGKFLTAGGVYLYNDSNSVYLNETKLNSTIDARASPANLTNYALKNQSEIFTGNITTTQTGFFGYLGSLTSKITQLFVQQIDVSTNATIEALIIKRYDAFGPVILLNSTADAIRIYAAPNITNPAQGAGIQVFGNAEGFFPGDVYIDAGSTSGGQIIMRTGTTGLNNRIVVEDDGRVRVLNLTGSGNDFLCVDANGYLFRSNTAC